MRSLRRTLLATAMSLLTVSANKESGDRYMNRSYPTWDRLEQHFPNPLRDSSQKMHIFAEINNGRVGKVYDENGNVEHKTKVHK